MTAPEPDETPGGSTITDPEVFNDPEDAPSEPERSEPDDDAES